MAFIVSANLKDSDAQKYYKERFEVREDNFSAWIQSKLLEEREKEEDPDQLTIIISQKEGELESLKKKHLRCIEKRIANDQIKASSLKKSKVQEREETEKKVYRITASMGIYLPKIERNEAEVLALEYIQALGSNKDLQIRDFLISKGLPVKPLKAFTPSITNTQTEVAA